MKKRIWLGLVCLATILIAVWTGNCLPKPDTNLEFWIAEKVDDADFLNYQEKFGLMGGREYYGRGYAPSTANSGEQTDPEHCVLYTVTSYPDYMSGKQHVTRITITDPAVELYGVSLRSSPEEIKAAMAQHGFRQKTHPHASGETYVRGKFSLRFAEDSIHISVKVRNLLGIQF